MATPPSTAATSAVRIGRDVEEDPRRDAGERDVADPVADERLPPLHEEEPDRRSEHSDDRARAEREAHELTLEHGRATGRARRPEGRAASRRRRSCDGRARAARRSARPHRTRARRTGSSPRARSEAGERSAASDSCDSTSTPVVGSSSTRSDGSPASAFAMNARCCMPPESVRSGASATVVEPDAFDRLGDELPIPPAKRPDQPPAASLPGRDDLTHGRRSVAAELGALREVAERASPREAVGGLAEERGRPLATAARARGRSG